MEQEKAQSAQVDKFGNPLTHSKRQILGWKGDRTSETFVVSQVTDKELVEMITAEFEGKADNGGEGMQMIDTKAISESTLEELREGWLIGFIQAKGFTYLINIIQTIISKNQNAEQATTLASKAEVTTLRLSTYLVKVILVSCFCSQTQDSNLAGNL